MKRFIELCAVQIVILIAFNIIYMGVTQLKFLSIYGVFFYDGIIRLVISIVLVGILVLLSRKLLRIDYKDIIISLLICSFWGFTFLSLVLVSLDRSYSVFLLSYMYDHYEEYEMVSSDELDKVMNDIFISEYGMLDRRFDEQVISGNIEKDAEENKYRLTDSGRKLVNIFKIIGKIYNIDDDFINP